MESVEEMIRRVASRVASVEEERGAEQDHYTWERFHNAVRPHLSFDLMTPAEYLGDYHAGLASIEKVSYRCRTNTDIRYMS